MLNLHYVCEEINRLLYLKEGLCHLAIKCKFIIQNKIPWGCSCVIYKVSSIDVLSRWIIRLRDMTPSQKNIAWFGFSFVKNTCLMGFGFDLWCGFRIFLFGFWFLFDQSGHYAPPLISKSRETSVCSTCQHCIGSIKVYVLTVLRFSVFDRIFVVVVFLRFCGWFFFGVSKRPSHGFLFCKLKISLSKITDLPFRSVPCLKLE